MTESKEETDPYKLVLEGLDTEQLRVAFDKADQIGETRIGEDVIPQASIAAELAARVPKPHILGEYTIDRLQLAQPDEFDDPYKLAKIQQELALKK